MTFGTWNREKLLGIIAIIFMLMGAANALEYFFAGKNYLRVYKGRVAEVEHNIYEGGRNRMYAETKVRLQGNSSEFSIYDNAMEGGYLEVQAGDSVTLYVRRFYQSLYNFSLKGNIYYVEQDGKLKYNNLSAWKSTAFPNMCYLGGIGLFLLIIYLDVGKNISISNWFKKHFLNKKGY